MPPQPSLNSRLSSSPPPPFDRARFRTWAMTAGKCDTRETARKRDGTNVVTDSTCRPVSGAWISPYDGVHTTMASDLDMDHLVPLREAWVSGTSQWADAQREAFANEPDPARGIGRE